MALDGTVLGGTAPDGPDLDGPDLGGPVPGDPWTGDPVLSDLQAATDRLYEVGPAAYAEGPALRELLAHQARLGAFLAQAVAAFDASGAWSLAGARSATAWLRAEARLSRKDASGQVRRGRALRRLPEAAAAWGAGAITGDHVDLLAPLCSGTTQEALVRDEPVLVAAARTLTHDRFARTLAYWRQLADRDGTDRDAEAGVAGRDAYLVSSFSGTWLGRLTLDPIAGTAVAGELRRLEELLFEAEWAEARDRLGREPTVTDLPRTPGQRRADAFVEMARRSKTAPVDGRKPQPLVTVLVGYETLHGRIAELEDGTVVAPSALLPWLEGADLERAEYRPDGTVAIGATATLRTLSRAGLEQAVFAPVTRKECPPADRCFTGATRRAIEVRDRQCCHPDCDIPASRCQVDHVQPYSQGGPTTQANGRLLCGPHNRMRTTAGRRSPPQRE
jgi:Domain of unknown function (DUF222)/HNH endonuclease